MSSPASVHGSVSSDALHGPELEVFALRAAEQDVLVVVGEADTATATSLYDQLVRALPTPPRPVVVELGALTFCGLSGLDALRDVERCADAAGVPLSFRGQSAQLQWLQRFAPAPGSQGSGGTPARAGAPAGAQDPPC